MRINLYQLAAVAGLLACGWAGGGEVLAPPLGRCIAALADEGQFGIETCRAQQKREVIRPGVNRCAASSHVVQGRIRCGKSDAATTDANTGTSFKLYHPTLSAPVSIGGVNSFYAGRHAGKNNRFQVRLRGDNKLAVAEKSTASSEGNNCIFQPDANQCTISTNFTGRRQKQTRRFTAYKLQLDGLLVEEAVQTRRCVVCSPFGCAVSCLRYGFSPPSPPTAKLYPWN